jgi:phosphoribosylformylglycinamidine synthase PurS subunit
MNVKALVHVKLKTEVLDPQGKAIARACTSLGLDAIRGVRQGKLFEIEIDADEVERARALVTEIGDKLLANPVIEDFEIVHLQ